MEDVKSCDEYVRSSSPAKRSGLKYMQIVKDDSSKYFPKLRPQTIPTVAKNGLIAFMTGDIVYSNLPRLAEKPYCMLELYMVVRVEGKYYMTDLAARPSASREVVKTAEKEQP